MTIRPFGATRVRCAALPTALAEKETAADEPAVVDADAEDDAPPVREAFLLLPLLPLLGSTVVRRGSMSSSSSTLMNGFPPPLLPVFALLLTLFSDSRGCCC